MTNLMCTDCGKVLDLKEGYVKAANHAQFCLACCDLAAQKHKLLLERIRNGTN